jgi:hypothetical protein
LQGHAELSSVARPDCHGVDDHDALAVAMPR